MCVRIKRNFYSLWYDGQTNGLVMKEFEGDDQYTSEGFDSSKLFCCTVLHVKFKRTLIDSVRGKK